MITYLCNKVQLFEYKYQAMVILQYYYHHVSSPRSRRVATYTTHDLMTEMQSC